MKWLLLLPFWVFFICYIVRESGEEKVVSRHHQQSANESRREILEPVAAIEHELPVTREARVSGVDMAQSALQFRDKVELLPVIGNDSEMSPLWPIGKQADVLAGFAFGEVSSSWRLFESDNLSFYLPEIDTLRVEVVESMEEIPMIGAIFHRKENFSGSWYRIVAGENITWAVIAVEDAELFDERERHPVAEIFHRTLALGGGVARFSLDGTGHICRAQWLGHGKRVSLLAWQHSSMNRATYAALAASVELGGALRIPKSRLNKLIGAVTMTTKLRMGLLERGMRANEVEELLGKPVGNSGGELIYHSTHRDGDSYYRVGLGEDDTFKGLNNDWIKTRKDPPLRGTIEWMLEKTEIRAGAPGGIGYDIGMLSEKDVVFIFAQVRNQIATAGGKQWVGLCRVLENLADLKLRDEQTLKLLRARFLDEEVDFRPVIPVLWRWSPVGSRHVFMQKAKDVISGFRWQSPVSRPVSHIVEDLRVLLDFIGQDHPGSGELLALMIEHPSIRLREVGFSLWRWLKGDQLRSVVLKGVSDTSDRVRFYCAEAIEAGCAMPEDVDFLRQRLQAERVLGIREKLSSAIDAIEP
ncbi:MAG: hypothetical protein GY899_17585 [Verrucomicrobiaceae bacterium]|nr:hypothetical protein [Verrucomicrobiaceae bacterium]